MVNTPAAELSARARSAAQARDWNTVTSVAVAMLEQDQRSAEGHFLFGLAAKAGNRPDDAIRSFSEALKLDECRYDAAVELADLYVRGHEYGKAAELLAQAEPLLSGSPRYLDMAGTAYARIGLPDRACTLHERAVTLQPAAASLRAHLASAQTFVGRLDEAKRNYRLLLAGNPGHQRNHYELSRLERASDTRHVEQMKAIACAGGRFPERNIYINYAIGKELEDLEQWEESFHYYELASRAAARVSRYDVQADIDAMQAIMGRCDEAWALRAVAACHDDDEMPVPIFVVGLPRSGTTLTERILSCHSRIGTVGETLFLARSLGNTMTRDGAKRDGTRFVDTALRSDPRAVRSAYLASVAYKLDGKPLFVEKFPENFLYLGWIAAAFPESPIIWLDRHPLDNCFALYKQSFFRYAYSLDDVGRYFVAYDRLRRHWRKVLGSRLHELRYEALVTDQVAETRSLLDRVGVPFESGCLAFENNPAATDTASTVQVREKMHGRSIGRWRHYARQLTPLRRYLEENGVSVD